MTKLKVDQALRRAKTHERKGEIEQAQRLYKDILATFPKNVRARQSLDKLKYAAPTPAATSNPSEAEVTPLLKLYNEGQNTKFIEQAGLLTRQYPNSFVLYNLVGAGHRKLGQFEQAEIAFRKASEKNPNSPDVYKNLGATLFGLRKFDEAVLAYKRLILLQPEYAAAYNGLGLVLREQSALEEAVSVFKRAVTLQPDYAEAHNNMGLTLYRKGDVDTALIAYQDALAAKPDYAVAYYNIGNAYKKKGQFTEAIEAYKQALEIDPGYANALNNMANTLMAQGHLDEALVKLNQAISLQPNSAVIYNNIGNIWLEKNDLDEAYDAYQKALSINPDYAEAYNNLGTILNDRGDFEGAIAAYKKAIALRPESSEAYSNMGASLKNVARIDEAIAAFRQAVTLQPDNAEAECAMLHQMQHICDWGAYSESNLVIPQLGITTKAVSAFAMLSMEDNPDRQKARAQFWSRENFKNDVWSPRAKSATKPKKLRIGYFGADFHDHPALYLLLGMLRAHDTTQFEIHVFSFGRDKTGALRKRAEFAVEQFHDVAEMTDQDIATFARSHELDIAIDLMGYTKNSRTSLFRYHLAPIQVNFLGFPGTMGADFIDYIVGDPTVIPKDQRQAYTEQILYMPHSYLPNDNTLPISDKQTTRTDFGLPEDGIVLCCFNNNYKISPREFDIWIRIMHKVEDSVLWMIRSNAYSENNLRKEAQARGVDPSRLIMAEKVPHPEHMARHRHADILSIRLSTMRIPQPAKRSGQAYQ